MTLHLLKVHLQTFLSIPIIQNCKILSCDTFVANEQYVINYVNYMGHFINNAQLGKTAEWMMQSQ